ncbi:MAG: PAS domain-containing protein, partial [Phycisphaerae bacterium]
MATLKSIAPIVKKTFNVDVNDMLGMSIHNFHTDPEAIERILSNPANFPRKADIKFDQLILETNIDVITDATGQVVGHVANWEEVGSARLAALEAQAQIDAISKAQAVIEFAMDGTIITANDNFLAALGYTLGEVQGQHHSMFVDPAFRQSPEYNEFWAKLNRGEFEAKEYKRIGKGGKEVWIKASYNPILNAKGKPYKVIKYAIDVTADALARVEIEKLTQAAQAGELRHRADTSRLSGDAAQLVVGVNKLVDAFVEPINVTATYVDRISKGDIPPKITEEYHGDFNAIKMNLNACIDVMNRLLAEMKHLIEASRAGQLSTRGDASKFAGSWGE